MDEPLIIRETMLCSPEKELPFIVCKNTGISAVPYHLHEHIEILYVVSGHATILISDQSYAAGEGDICIINCDDVHYVPCGDWEIIVIQVKPAMLCAQNAALFESNSFSRFMRHQVAYTKFIPCTSHTKAAQGFILDMYEEYEAKKTGFALSIKGDIYKLFGWFARNEYIIFPSACEVIDENELDKIKNVLAYISDHFSSRLTEKDIAASCFMSYHHFCRTFQKATHMHFVDYLMYVRICHAEKLLMETNKSITEIAFESGFASGSYFSSCFRKIKGIVPSQIRKSKIVKM